MYEYECASCGRRFEHRRGMTDDRPDPDCPSCGASRARRVFSVFATLSMTTFKQLGVRRCAVVRIGFDGRNGQRGRVRCWSERRREELDVRLECLDLLVGSKHDDGRSVQAVLERSDYCGTRRTGQS